MYLMEQFLIPELLSKFKVNPNDYSLRFENGTLLSNISKKLSPENNSGIVLSYKGLDSALISFIIKEKILNCTQIQGGIGRYKQLTPIRWDRLLLNKTLSLSRDLGLEEVTILTARPEYTSICGWDYNNP